MTLPDVLLREPDTQQNPVSSITLEPLWIIRPVIKEDKTPRALPPLWA